MTLWLRNIAAYLICAIASTALVHWIESSVVTDVLIPNLTAIIIGLLAINVQTTAVIAVKLRELSDKHGYDFKASIQEFRLAIFEQATLVIISLALSALVTAKGLSPPQLFIEGTAFFIAYASLHIFLDTTIGLLVSLFQDSSEK